MVTAFAQQKFYDEYGNGKAPVRTVHILPLPHGDVKERPNKVGKAYRDQMFFNEAEVMEGLVQRVITEQPEPRNEKETGDSKTGKDLEQEKKELEKKEAEKRRLMLKIINKKYTLLVKKLYLQKFLYSNH